MQFKCEKEVEDNKEPVAVLYKFAGGPTECLAVKEMNNRTTWFYPDGDVETQTGGFPDNDDVVKKFYKGDSILITF